MDRTVGPYFIDDGESTSASLFYQTFNRNKRSLTLNLTTEEGQDIFRELVRTADAITCNLRGDVPAKLALTYETLGAINPKIVCSFLSAYGREGPRATWPGYDYLMQAEAGYFSLTGEPGTSLTPCAQYRTRDGWIFIMCNKEKFRPTLCEKIGRPEWSEEPRFLRFRDRLEQRALI
jgi:crotonobetainyl-CoA:carnitine CoA-transferase CaiB-like acyl-CoA transferase